MCFHTSWACILYNSYSWVMSPPATPTRGLNLFFSQKLVLEVWKRSIMEDTVCCTVDVVSDNIN